MNRNKIRENDSIVLISVTKLDKLCLKIEDNIQKFPKFGVFNPIKLVGTPFGSIVKLGSREYWILPANTLDYLETLNRKAQIILPKDSALIAMLGNIGPGAKVVECGLGSGALTTYLLHLVGEKGKVITYENRKDFAKIGSDNVYRAFKGTNWVLKLKDITIGIEEVDFDAIVLDIPEPWLVVDTSYDALKPGGYLMSFLPTMNQVERFVQEIHKHRFIEIKSIENIQRELLVKIGATRPSYDMLGHTGYITAARKVLV